MDYKKLIFVEQHFHLINQNFNKDLRKNKKMRIEHYYGDNGNIQRYIDKSSSITLNSFNIKLNDLK